MREGERGGALGVGSETKQGGRQKCQTRSETEKGGHEEEYANDKVWLAVGGISSSGGNMCVGTNCRQEFIRLVVR